MNTNADDARARVRGDHARLKQLMLTVLAGSCVAQDDPSLVPRVRVTLERMRDELFAHHAYSEHVLLELLRDADAWGRVRAEALLDEQRAERAMVDAVVEDFGAYDRSFEDVAEEIAWLAAALEKDWEEEERSFLSDEALGDGPPVSIQQTDG